MTRNTISVTCLVDNTVRRGSHLWGEHGLAFLLEAGGKRLLFDTGQSGTVLLHNMKELGIDPQTIDVLAISHAHYDHTGGLPTLLAHVRSGLPLYAHPDLFCERFSRHASGVESIGLPLTREDLAAQTSLRLSAAALEILPGVWWSGEIADRPEPEGRSAHHVVRAKDGWEPDPYRDDMGIVIETSIGLTLLCGCCHAGLLNTLTHAERMLGRPVTIVAGGTHLVSADEKHLRHVVEMLARSKGLRHIYLNHCSGEAAYQMLSQVLGRARVQPYPAGTRIKLEARS